MENNIAKPTRCFTCNGAKVVQYMSNYKQVPGSA